MTPREKFTAALERKPVTGLVPTFELVFFLTMEKFGKIHVAHRDYRQWDQMSETEKRLHRKDVAKLYVETAQTYGHDAIFAHPYIWTREEIIRMLEAIRELSGDRYFLMTYGDPTFSIPDGEHMAAFSYRIADDPEGLKREAQKGVDNSLEFAEKLSKHNVLDGFAMCSDYCLNTGPFMSPAQFSEFVTPYLAQVNAGYRDMGFYSIKHTDGNIMPILDQLVESEPDALHSIDPQAGVDLGEVKRLYGDRICLIGNVNCGLLQTGTDEEVAADVRRALRQGMPGYGYIFSTSNCVYTGMPLERYELMLSIYRKEGVYR